MSDFNSTAAPEMASGGEQAEVVAQQNTHSQTDAQGATARSAAVVEGESPESEGQEGVVDLPTVNADFAMVDTDSGAADEAPTGKKPAAPTPDSAGRDGARRAQSAEENAVYHSMRLRAQREAEAQARAALDAEIAGLGIEDPYNAGRTLNNLSDLRAYSERFRKGKLAAEAQKTGRSVSELEEDAANRAFLSSLRRASAARNAAETQQMQQAQEQKAFVDADVLDFVRKYPEMDVDGLAALENNRQFRQFCGSRFGREPLAQLYGDYLSFVGDAGAAAVAKASSRSARSTGSGAGGGAILSPAQKIALDRWNAENPEMAMTAKEFLGR